jgi:SAM-dependent methyltransferase
MSEQRLTTSVVNGRLWGASADDWAAIQEPCCRPVYTAVLDKLAVGAGTTYLDAGCGTGMAAERGASISGLDAAEPLLAIARRRVPQGDFRVGELEELPFADATFDLVTGFNAFQYAADTKAALAEAKRVAKPGATVVIMTWGPPAGMEAASLVAALRPLLPPPPPGAPGPFALSDQGALRAFAEAAGLEPVEVMDVDSPWVYADLATALRGLGSSGVAARAAGQVGREAVDAAHAAALAPFVQPDGSYRVGAMFRCLIARV